MMFGVDPGQAVGTASALSILVGVLLAVFRMVYKDNERQRRNETGLREEWRRDRDQMIAEHHADMDRAEKRCDHEIADLRQQLADLRAEVALMKGAR